MENNTSAIILAAGRGVRFNYKGYPKALVPVLGKPLFLHCVERYVRMKEIDSIYLVIHPDLEQQFDRALTRYLPSKKVTKVLGGTDRQSSFTNALDRISGNHLIVVQNGVSPATPPTLIRKCLQIASEKGAATAFYPPFHTVFTTKGGQLTKTLERPELGYTCDPQVYRASIIREAIAQAQRQGLQNRPTVDLVRRIGRPVFLVESDPSNIKVTTKIDLKTVEEILRNSSHA